MAASPRLVMIDNVDSFTFILVDLLRAAGAEVRVVRGEPSSIAEAMAEGVGGVVISPGPGRPEDATASLEIARRCLAASRPLFGVCLGHQAIALACGGRITRVAPVHGKALPVRHDGSGLFDGLPSPFAATRYHSLAVTELPLALIANAWSEDGIVMGLRHPTEPIYGVQFHPESVASEQGAALAHNFVTLVLNRG